MAVASVDSEMSPGMGCLTDKLLIAFAIREILGCGSHGTHDHNLVSGSPESLNNIGTTTDGLTLNCWDLARAVIPGL
jgi:hypothetical protein